DPVVYLSPRLQAYVAATLFADGTTLEALAQSPEVQQVERQAASRGEPLPDAFIFFNAGRTEMRMLLWTYGGFTLLDRRLDRGTFSPPRAAASCERLRLREVARLLEGTPEAAKGP
ncbi:MAG TPA: IS66 family insertion sequence element accessory protein TnpB, partial [Myxococcales bacterium]|nr:IS66 family insertion sequence element accessory protein TnpB [Myxococcales bacterium]